MLQEISYYLIFGRPLILYLGIITLCSFLVTASIPVLSRRGILKIPFAWHVRMAVLSITLGILHGILGAAAYL
jgi:hypothetical protein